MYSFCKLLTIHLLMKNNDNIDSTILIPYYPSLFIKKNIKMDYIFENIINNFIFLKNIDDKEFNDFLFTYDF